MFSIKSNEKSPDFLVLLVGGRAQLIIMQIICVISLRLSPVWKFGIVQPAETDQLVCVHPLVAEINRSCRVLPINQVIHRLL